MNKTTFLFAVFFSLCIAACSNSQAESTSAEAGSTAKQDSSGCKSVVSRKDIAR